MAALSLQDRVALIYTSQGSQRAVARLLGISHQQVGRILKAGQEGGYKADSAKLSDPGLQSAVNQGFAVHRSIVKDRAKADGLPYNSAIPVYYARLPRKVTQEVVDKRTGELVRVPVIDPRTGAPKTVPGDRVSAHNIQWMSDRLRSAWIGSAQKTGKFAAASVGSLVNLQVYKKKGDQAQRGMGPRNEKQRTSRAAIVQKIQAGETLSPMFSKPIPFDFPEARVAKEFDKVLRQKHQPATGPQLPGTLLANQVLFQVDTRNAPLPKKTPARKTRKKTTR